MATIVKRRIGNFSYSPLYAFYFYFIHRFNGREYTPCTDDNNSSSDDEPLDNAIPPKCLDRGSANSSPRLKGPQLKRPPIRQTSIQSTEVAPQPYPSNVKLYWFIGCIGCILGLAFAYANLPLTNKPSINACSFDSLEHDYPNQLKTLWKALRIGIERVLTEEPTRPAIFLLAYHDYTRSEQLLDRIVENAVKCMNTNLDPLKLNSQILSTPEFLKDYGLALDQYTQQLQKHGVLLVYDLNTVHEQRLALNGQLV